jgi:hypothetical protein
MIHKLNEYFRTSLKELGLEIELGLGLYTIDCQRVHL